jgi:hypothetical protein
MAPGKTALPNGGGAGASVDVGGPAVFHALPVLQAWSDSMMQLLSVLDMSGAARRLCRCGVLSAAWRAHRQRGHVPRAPCVQLGDPSS